MPGPSPDCRGPGPLPGTPVPPAPKPTADPESNLLQVALEWLGTRGLLGLFLAAFITVLRALLGFEEAKCQKALSFAATLFVVDFVAPAVSELVAIRPEGSSVVRGVLGLTACHCPSR